MRWTPKTLLEQYMLSVQDSHSLTAEQFRVLHARLEQLQKVQDCKVFCITSALKEEGKTFTAVNLAVTMARDFGKRVLLMDVDCKKTTTLKLTGREDQEHVGWADVVLKKSSLPEVLTPFIHEKLFLLPVGQADCPSSSLIASLRSSGLLKELKKEFDYIVIDAPPILPLVDMRLLEDLVDGIIMVVRAEKTTKDIVLKASASLRRDKIMGLVLNDIKRGLKHYYYYPYSYDGKQTLRKGDQLRILE